MSKLLQPQEVEVLFILPAIRRHMAGVMKKRGLEQREIAKRLGVTEPAISQYLRKKRGAEAELSDEMKKATAEASERVKNPLDFVREAQQLVARSLDSGHTCSTCKNVNKNHLEQNCHVCFG